MPTCQLIKSLLDSNEDFLDWQTPRLEKHEIDCDGPSNGRLRQNGAPDYESGGQKFESLRARQLNQKLRMILLIGPGAIRAARVHNQVHDRAASATVSSRTAPLSLPREFLLSF